MPCHERTPTIRRSARSGGHSFSRLRLRSVVRMEVMKSLAWNAACRDFILAFSQPLAAVQRRLLAMGGDAADGLEQLGQLRHHGDGGQTKAEADVMAEQLMRFGWNTSPSNIQWYEPNATGFDYGLARNSCSMSAGAAGSQPLPSAANEWVQSLAEYVHRKGLKFGCHSWPESPVRRCENRHQRHAVPRRGHRDRQRVCPWTRMYGVDRPSPGQAITIRSSPHRFRGTLLYQGG